MAIGRLEFQLPEENEEWTAACKGADWKQVVWALDERLRSQLKYTPLTSATHKALEEMRTLLHEELTDRGLQLF